MPQLSSVRAFVFGASLFVPCAAPALAQTQQRSATGWEVEGHGGIAVIRLPSGGKTSLPDAGAPLTSTSPIFPARRAPSWFFGDGAAMLNDVATELGVGPRLVPLDAAFAGLGEGASGGAIYGLRVRRWLSPRVTGELNLDVLRGSADLPEDLIDAAEATRESFEATFTGLFASGPFAETSVTSVANVAGGSSRQVAFTGTVNLYLSGGARIAPYVTLGGGVISGVGDGETLTIEGRYRTRTTPAGPAAIAIDETDRITLRYGHATTFVGVAGAGLRQDLAGGWGVRVDARMFLGSNNTRLRLDAAPEVARSSPAGYIETFTHPNLQFSTDPSSGRESTLSDALEGFEVFKGGGMHTRFMVTVGIVWRF